MKRRTFLLGATAATLSGCGARSIWAPDSQVQRARYRHNGAPSFTLFTMKNVGSDYGSHTAMMVNASERIIFDPFGTFEHPTIPERNDVFFGINPSVLDFFIDYHARTTYYVQTDTVRISMQQAEDLYRRTLQAGPVGSSFCTISTSTLLAETPGLNIKPTLFPDRLQAQVKKLPGVVENEFRDMDEVKDTAIFARYAGQKTGRFNVE